MTELEQIKFYSEHYQDYLPKCPIVIPSYQNREGTILKDLKSLSDNKIMLFIYDTDYPKYKQYEDNQVEIVQIPEKWRSIQRKRHWIQVYLANNRPEIENYIMIDDDIRKAKVRCFKENGSVTSKYIPIKNAFGILEEVHKKYSNTISGGAGANTNILSDKLYKNTYFYQTFCFNNKWVKDHPQCMFRDLQNVSEDNVIWYDCWCNEQKYYSFEFLYFEFNTQRSKSYSSIASTSTNVMKNNINALRIIKQNCKVHWSNEWNCWGIRFVPNYYEKLWPQLKILLDENMPGWEDLTVTFDDKTYQKVFTRINNDFENILNKKASVSTISDFFE